MWIIMVGLSIVWLSEEIKTYLYLKKLDRFKFLVNKSGGDLNILAELLREEHQEHAKGTDHKGKVQNYAN